MRRMYSLSAMSRSLNSSRWFLKLVLVLMTALCWGVSGAYLELSEEEGRVEKDPERESGEDVQGGFERAAGGVPVLGAGLVVLDHDFASDREDAVEEDPDQHVPEVVLDERGPRRSLALVDQKLLESFFHAASQRGDSFCGERSLRVTESRNARLKMQIKMNTWIATRSGSSDLRLQRHKPARTAFASASKLM